MDTELEPNAWSLAADDLQHVVALVRDRGLTEVVELGSGAGTVGLARGLPTGARLTSVEHDPRWVERVAGALAATGLDGVATVLHAPLVPGPPAALGAVWYSKDALETLPSGIELLLVDGPPANLPGMERGRAPALAVLRPKLDPDALVVLDDVNRPGERSVLASWEASTELRFRIREGGRIAVGSAA